LEKEVMSQIIKFYVPTSFVRKSSWQTAGPGRLIQFLRPVASELERSDVWRRHKRASGSSLDWMKIDLGHIFQTHPGLE
jgi:hypothetical protein